ncbi:MAG: sulfite exporter TauE/SafE family protein [Flavobacteriaceae bacterium]|nr:sulfite exporter TauE/SafE family protein [Flavobacteriaceae bacterium]
MNYLEILKSFDLSIVDWFIISLAVFILGMGKAGVKGFGVITVISLAFVFGEKSSTGVLLPMLVFADTLAVFYYKRHVQWEYIFKLLPWMVAGVLVGVWVGDDISHVVFKNMMAIIIIISVVAMLFLEIKKNPKVPTNNFFSVLIGLLAGFTTMIGNLAGPIANIYFLAIRFPKNEFIGTAAMLFFIVNLFKVPFHIFVWKTVSVETLVLNSVLFPVVIVGFVLGFYVVKKISNINYRRFILVITAVGGIIMLLKS